MATGASAPLAFDINVNDAIGRIDATATRSATELNDLFSLFFIFSFSPMLKVSGYFP
ncbi:unannotated protein [freshwater metagenome]|uniref:Unannotated protein n=1 Tax=freshwater metagenome TaxID=449393 RepID=A0A6J6BUA5_9ZZZZ